jgi:acyl-ACP thioesterase
MIQLTGWTRSCWSCCMPEQADVRLAGSYRVRFDESGPDGRLPAAGFLRYAQDLAWLHSAGQGFDRRWYGELGLTWLVRAIELDLVEPVSYGEGLQAATEVMGFRRVWARRRTEFTRTADQRPLARAIIDWVLLNDNGQPARVPLELVQHFSSAAKFTFTPLRVPLGPTPADAVLAEFHVRRSELDPMAHVNNAAYLDYIDEQLVLAGRESAVEHMPRRYRLEYVAPAEAGARLRGALWRAEHGWHYRLESLDGRETVRASVDTEPTVSIGG